MKNRLHTMGLVMIAFFIFSGFSFSETVEEVNDEEVSIYSHNVAASYLPSTNRIAITVLNGTPNATATVFVAPYGQSVHASTTIRLNSAGNGTTTFTLPSNARGTWAAGARIGNTTKQVNVRTR
ncbi:hypothetical protein [Shouchella hunanensis]|uniref:Uncharacterized protein n=1 Tax=Shouchella hunanensis TaxID=766894 RepID=A0ABY7W325_9BACI|nr:hypothetical protein [Shouchella hunanensis]WDF01994.1 hypothetical protein PQ477_10700 [Shouchella hunanensis]